MQLIIEMKIIQTHPTSEFGNFGVFNLIRELNVIFSQMKIKSTSTVVWMIALMTGDHLQWKNIRFKLLKRSMDVFFSMFFETKALSFLHVCNEIFVRSNRFHDITMYFECQKVTYLCVWSSANTTSFTLTTGTRLTRLIIPFMSAVWT